MADTAADDFSAVSFEDTGVATPEPPKRRRRRSAAEVSQSAGEFITANVEEPKTTRTRRSKKITGKQVAEGISKGSTLIVMATKELHWAIPEDEVRPWSDEAAELLNRIPASYVETALNFSAIATVLFGVYSVAAPRMELSRQAKMERVRAAREAQIAVQDELGYTSVTPFGQ